MPVHGLMVMTPKSATAFVSRLIPWDFEKLFLSFLLLTKIRSFIQASKKALKHLNFRQHACDLLHLALDREKDRE